MKTSHAALAAILAACTSIPSNTPGDVRTLQRFDVATYELESRGPFSPSYLGFGSDTGASRRAVTGATCRARNALGTMETVTPGTIRPPIGAGPLFVECTKPGYRLARLVVPCVSPTTRMAIGAIGLAAALAAVPRDAWSTAPWAVAIVGGTVATATAAELYQAQPDADVCRYYLRASALDVPMEAEGTP